MQNTEVNIEQFSSHLFWDTDKNKLDMVKSKRYIVQQVLEYGQIKDWVIIENYYGVDQIASVATQLPSLEPKALSFISSISSIPIDSFRCYTLQQSRPTHWHF
ncbi:MAG: hypothetical protein ACJA2S_003135 [Cyclobacteriaceae bacterium]|jgi:hypothetical protein